MEFLLQLTRENIFKYLQTFWQEDKALDTSEELRKLYNKNKLDNIRENWKTMFFVLKIVAIIVMVILSFSTDGMVLIRNFLLIIMFLVFIGLSYLIQLNNFAAKYCGCITTFAITVLMTELNVNLDKYRLYEGFMAQISVTFAFVTWVTLNWGVATVSLLISYSYFIIRIASTFGDEVPENLYVAVLETIFFHSVGSYLFSKTLKREFLANYKHKKSSKGFHKFLHSLPEGVTIVDDLTAVFKFVNPKFKHTLDVNTYFKGDEHKNAFEEFQLKVNSEFDTLIRDIKMDNTDSLTERQATIEKMLENYRVTTFEEADNNRDSGISPELKNHAMRRSNREESKYVDESFDDGQSVKSDETLSLNEFLCNERKLLKSWKLNSRQIKAQIHWSIPNLEGQADIQKREFIVKTKRIMMGDEITEQHALFMHMFIDTTQISQLEEARAQNRYQRQMLANVSHEFRTPLNAMMMSLTLLKDQVVGPNAKFLRIASSSWDILAALVEDILDHAKIESGVFEIQNNEFKLAQLFEEVHSIFELQAANRKIDLIFWVDESLSDIEIMSDKQRLKQILLNLISNSLKFTDKGFIKVEAKIYRKDNEAKFEENKNVIFNDQGGENEFWSENICFTEDIINRNTSNDLSIYVLDISRNKRGKTNRNQTCVVEKIKSDFNKPMKVMVTVQDTGIGIPAKDQMSLFKLFGKLSSNHDRNKTGCGLGLTICKKILKKLGGDISLTSVEKKGTRVECTFQCLY